MEKYTVDFVRARRYERPKISNEAAGLKVTFSGGKKHPHRWPIG